MTIENYVTKISQMLGMALLLSGGMISPGQGSGSIPGPPSWAKVYRRVWAQDFTIMKRLEQLGVSDTRIGSGTWIAHTPSSRDWFAFANPTSWVNRAEYESR